MMKIATHNSATGESGHGIISWLVTPFSRCQSKTIKEQYYAGCRYFDIRVRKTKRGWVCAHGLWESKRSVEDVLAELNSLCNCYVNITYEGYEISDYRVTVNTWVSRFCNISFSRINVKEPQWRCIDVIHQLPYEEYFLHLDGSSWHTYLPIPWLWKRIYYDNPVFGTDSFTFVDFL